MYRIITTEGTELGITDSVLFIKVSAEGAYVEATEDEAVGIAFESTPYNLNGHTEIAGAKTVILVKTTFAQIMKEQAAAVEKFQANMDYLAMMSDVNLETETTTEEVPE